VAGYLLLKLAESSQSFASPPLCNRVLDTETRNQLDPASFSLSSDANANGQQPGKSYNSLGCKAAIRAAAHSNHGTNTMMLNETMQEAVNQQINNELFSMYSYLSMSAYCEHKQFRGCAHWMRLQSGEEYGHAMRLYDFLIARQGRVKLQPIAQPQFDFASIPDVFQKALEQEQTVTAQINSLYEMAFKEKSFAALVELEWFINEQVEEEKTARDIVAKFQLVKDDPAALLDLDRELGSRQPEAAATA
jgi:ferritin